MRKVSRLCVLAVVNLAAVLATATGQVSAAPAGTVHSSSMRSACRSLGTSFDDRMLPGQCIESGGYRLEMQYDGNLVLYSGSRACWASGTNGTDGVYAKYSGDWQIDSPWMSLESPFGQLAKYRGSYTGLHKTGDVSINGKGEVWIAYGRFQGC